MWIFRAILWFSFRIQWLNDGCKIEKFKEIKPPIQAFRKRCKRNWLRLTLNCHLVDKLSFDRFFRSSFWRLVFGCLACAFCSVIKSQLIRNHCILAKLKQNNRSCASDRVCGVRHPVFHMFCSHSTLFWCAVHPRNQIALHTHMIVLMCSVVPLNGIVRMVRCVRGVRIVQAKRQW